MSKEEYDILFNEILKLNSLEECRLFFDDLCTYNELDSMTDRIKAAKLLLNGKTYTEVQDNIKISSATLSRVSKCIKYGEGGYKSILEKEKK